MWRITNNRFRIIILLVTFLLALGYIYGSSLYLNGYSWIYTETDSIFKQTSRDFEKQFSEFYSKCECRKSEIVQLNKSSELYQIRVIKSIESGLNKSQDNNRSSQLLKNYQIDKEIFETSIFTCDLYNSLRRGPNLKTIAYSLYGRNKFYYYSLKELIKSIKKFYPDWIARIYYDSSIDESILCELECLMYKSEQTGEMELINNIDFCNIEKLPYDTRKTWNASYMHGIYIAYVFINFIER